MKKKKIFAISDIHGGYKEMINALKNANYDENNNEHLLVVLGDCFDRLEDSTGVYKYLKKLVDNNKAIWLMGNHEPMFISFLEGSYNPFNYMHNGTAETIGDFWHRTDPFESWCMLDEDCEINTQNYARWVNICRKDIMQEYPELLDFLKNRPYYFETKNHIFTHASIDTNVEDWHFPHCERYGYVDWQALTWDDGNFINKPNKTGKTIVAGHFDTGHLRKMHNLGDYNDHSILKTKDRKVFIDGCVPLTHEVNVYVVEDELL